MNLICRYCNYKGAISDFEIDHITPLSRGGLDTNSNKILICSGCNREKSDKTHLEYLLWRAAFPGQANYGPKLNR